MKQFAAWNLKYKTFFDVILTQKPSKNHKSYLSFHLSTSVPSYHLSSPHLSLSPFSFSCPFCSWNILFLLCTNKFAVALCLIPFQACSCFGNRRKNPHNKSNKNPFCEEELKTAGLKEDCTWDALFWLSTQLKSETHYHNLKQPTANTRQMVGNNPCIINK